MRTRNKEFLKLVWNELFNFVLKPYLFENYEELFEVDELHINLFEYGEDHTKFNIGKDDTIKAK